MVVEKQVLQKALLKYASLKCFNNLKIFLEWIKNKTFYITQIRERKYDHLLLTRLFFL